VRGRRVLEVPEVGGCLGALDCGWMVDAGASSGNSAAWRECSAVGKGRQRGGDLAWSPRLETQRPIPLMELSELWRCGRRS
jgi:hypothetical protein